MSLPPAPGSPPTETSQDEMRWHLRHAVVSHTEIAKPGATCPPTLTADGITDQYPALKQPEVSQFTH